MAVSLLPVEKLYIITTLHSTQVDILVTLHSLCWMLPCHDDVRPPLSSVPSTNLTHSKASSQKHYDDSLVMAV
jgi:hypothetical protein